LLEKSWRYLRINSKAIERLVKSPENTDIKKSKGMEVFRLRIGDYRVCFEIDKEAKAIII
jgi:mRNA-degrading endonuclease RelE of RelBE toxin-antitoxin system